MNFLHPNRYPPKKFPPKKFPAIKFPKLTTWDITFPSKNVLKYATCAKTNLFPIGFWSYNTVNSIIRKMIMFIIYILAVLTRNFLSYVVNFGNFMAGNFLGGNFLDRIRLYHLFISYISVVFPLFFCHIYDWLLLSLFYHNMGNLYIE